MDAFTAELRQVRQMFSTYSISPPLHSNMPPVVSKLMWVYGLKQRIKVGPLCVISLRYVCGFFLCVFVSP